MKFLLRKFRQRYSHLDNEEKNYSAVVFLQDHHGSMLIGYRIAVCVILLAAAAGALGLWLGQNAFRHLFEPSRDAPTVQGNGFHSNNITRRTFVEDSMYARAPSNETNKAWESLFPEGGGFLVDPLGIDGVGVSAFHQLHCLDLLRHLYYSMKQITTPDDETQMESFLHARHCIEYLRQAIICAADGALEPGNVTTRHIGGDGAVHECRDYDGLVRWTEGRSPADVEIPQLDTTPIVGN